MKNGYSRLAQLKKSLEPIGGGRLLLRLLTAEDLPTTLMWRNREDIRHCFIHSEIIGWEQHCAWWEDYRAKADDFVFVIEEIQQLHRPVGQISLYNINLEKGEAEYGRLMIGDNEARRKGLARRATELVLNWGFSSLGLNRIYLEVLKDNSRAINLYRRCKFVQCDEQEALYVMDILRNANYNSVKDE